MNHTPAPPSFDVSTMTWETFTIVWPYTIRREPSTCKRMPSCEENMWVPAGLTLESDVAAVREAITIQRLGKLRDVALPLSRYVVNYCCMIVSPSEASRVKQTKNTS